jgi:hypothetical protein
MLIDLNVFTNFTANRVEQLPLLATLQSFSAAFGFESFSNIRVFCHAAPLHIPFASLHAALLDAIPRRTVELYSTRGLADGYVQSIRLSAAETICQLEHDYLIDATRIGHGIPQIARAMRTAGVPYIRFNIGPNQDNALDRITAFDMAGIPCCKTVSFSNRPHLLDRDHAMQHYLPHIDLQLGGSRGIEDELTAAYREGWIYGPVGHPPVIRHIDGRTQAREWRKQRLHRLLIAVAARNAKVLREKFGLGRYGRIY